MNEKINIYVNKTFVLPLRVFFLLITFYFLLEISDILITGEALYRHGETALKEENYIRYWLKITEKFVISIFFVFLAYGVKDKNSKLKDE